MNKRLLFACFSLAVVHVPNQAYAQFSNPRTYQNSPVDINQLELCYSYLRTNTSIDTSLIITGAKLNVNQGMIDYTRYFGFLHRLMWVEAGVPVAGLGGSISGTNIQGSVTGAGDSSYALGILFKGGPAFTVEQFEHHKPTTTLGVSLTMTAPTGLYQANQILNLGSDCWSFKPEIGMSHSFGPEQKWYLDAYANVYFFTDNTSYHKVEILRQQPLPGLERHISYSFNESLRPVLANAETRAKIPLGFGQDYPRNSTLTAERAGFACSSSSRRACNLPIASSTVPSKTLMKKEPRRPGRTRS